MLLQLWLLILASWHDLDLGLVGDVSQLNHTGSHTHEEIRRHLPTQATMTT